MFLTLVLIIDIKYLMCSKLLFFLRFRCPSVSATVKFANEQDGKKCLIELAVVKLRDGEYIPSCLRVCFEPY